LPTQSTGVLFHLAFLCGACSGALLRLFPFLWGSSFDRLLFSLSWQQKSSSMTLKRREYHVDCRAKKAAIFFVACEQNPATRKKIPDAMRNKGYSPSKAANRALQMQVRCKAEKLKERLFLALLLLRPWPRLRCCPWCLWQQRRGRCFEQSCLIQRLLPSSRWVGSRKHA
jgi:hypothetical protein